MYLRFKSTHIVLEIGSVIRNTCRMQKLLFYYHVHKIHNIARSFLIEYSFYYGISYLYEIVFGKTLNEKYLKLCDIE